MNPLDTLLRWLAPLLDPLSEFRGQVAQLDNIHQNSVQSFVTLGGTLVESQAGPEAFTGQLDESFWEALQSYIDAERALAGVGATASGGISEVMAESATVCEECVGEITTVAEIAAAQIADDAILVEVTAAVDVTSAAQGGLDIPEDIVALILTLVTGLILLATLIKMGWDIYHAVQKWLSAMHRIGNQPLPNLPPTPTPQPAPTPSIPSVTQQPLTPQQQRLVNDIIARLSREGIPFDQREIEALVRAGYGYDLIIAILRTVDYAKTHNGAAQPGYAGNRPFANDGRNGSQVLPRTNPDGTPITYTEYDVYPYVKGVNRGAERIVIGSDGSIWYTSNHYRTSVKI